MLCDRPIALVLTEQMPSPDQKGKLVRQSSNDRQRGEATVKAQEVLRRYAAGDRNFCNANLQGANFKGQDLSGADFSGADIRSANFADARLRRANFAKAQAGLQRRWMIAQLLLIAVIATAIRLD